MRIFGLDIVSVKKSRLSSIKEYKVVMDSLQIAMDMIKVRISSMYKVHKSLNKEFQQSKDKKDISDIIRELSDMTVYIEGLSFEAIQIYPLYAAIISMMDVIVTNEIIMPKTILGLYNLTKNANEICNKINNKLENVSKIYSCMYSTFKIIEESDDVELVNSCISSVYQGYTEIHQKTRLIGIDIKSLIVTTAALSDVLIPDFINIKKDDHELYKEIKRRNNKKPKTKKLLNISVYKTKCKELTEEEQNFMNKIREEYIKRKKEKENGKV